MKVQEEYVMERSPGEIKPADTFGLLASRNVGKLIFFYLNYLLCSYGSPRKLIYYLLLLLINVGYSNPTKMLTSPGP